VPVDGLTPMAEEILVKKEKKMVKNLPFTQVDEDSEDSDKAEDDKEDLDPKKAHKKRVKEEKREKRRLKKELKLAF